MANLDHVAILHKGVEAWNKWRKANPEVEPDLRGIELVNECFNGIDFGNTDLSHSSLGGLEFLKADFENANLARAHIARCQMNEAKFSYANVFNADFFDTELANSNFFCIIRKYKFYIL